MLRVTTSTPTRFRRTRPMRRRGAAWLAVWLVGASCAPVVVSMGGCGTGDPAASEIAADTAKAPPPAPPPQPAPAEKNDFSGSKSVLGKAMEQAHKLEDKVEAYNKKIEDAAEGKHE